MMWWLTLCGAVVSFLAICYAALLPVGVYLWSPNSPRNRRDRGQDVRKDER